MTITWGEWKKQHPDTRVLSHDLGLLAPAGANPYDRDRMSGYSRGVNEKMSAFPVSEDKLNDRLRPRDVVTAIQEGEEHKAYRLVEDSDWPINAVVGGENILLIGRATGPTAAAYFRDVDGRELSFSLSDGAAQDLETGSTWDDTGLAVSGPLEGTRLTAAPSRTSFWFSLVGALPGVELHVAE